MTSLFHSNENQRWTFHRFLFTLTAFLLVPLIPVVSQTKEKTVKSGLNIGGLPAISYNSDEGMQYGIILNLFDYGDGSRFPSYDYSAYLEASRFTKGSGLLRFYFDSERLIKGIRSFIDLSYVQDDLLPFYGYNGYQSVFSMDTLTSNRTFYSMSQRQYRLMVDTKGSIGIDHLNWLLSYAFYHYTTGVANTEKLKKDLLPGDPDYLYGTSLYQKYIDWGIIRPNEANGGAVHTLKAGLVYDTRNVQVNPSRGICTEALLEIAPGFINEMPYTRYSLVHRQFHELIKQRLNLAIRVGAQGKIGANQLPFFRRSQLISPFATRSNVTGLGGDNSLRGILKNRLVGDGIAFSNLEIRWKAINIQAFNQQFYIGFNGFIDAGMVTDPVDMDLSSVSAADQTTYFSTLNDQSIHTAAGAGIKLAMNENFVISLDMGKALDKRDGEGLGTYIKINYLF